MISTFYDLFIDYDMLSITILHHGRLHSFSFLLQCLPSRLIRAVLLLIRSVLHLIYKSIYIIARCTHVTAYVI